jgi:predicted  nucleic acid-binding Zn-ribbon protein
MNEEATPELSIGLSAEERTELAQLITVLRTDKPADAPEPVAQTAEPQLKALQEQVSRCSEIILNFDSRLKSLYEIVCLFHEKSSKMNERINTIADAIVSKTL